MKSMKLNSSIKKYKRATALPGFGLSMGITVSYITLIVLLPLGAIFLRLAEVSWCEFWTIAVAPRALAAYRITFGASLAAALINAVFGVLIAWVLTRYQFPMRRLINGLVDLPFALPTAVAGIALTTLYAKTGWIGAWLDRIGIQAAFSWLGIFIALTFIGLPFVIRSVQPILEEFDVELEEASACMGAGPCRTFCQIFLPALWPAILSGFSLALARALGEYGSVVFISGNMPMKTEIVSLLIMTKLEQYDYKGATVLAFVMLVVSFLLMFSLNLVQSWSFRRSGRSFT